MKAPASRKSGDIADYIYVAVMQGDPRFCKSAHIRADFNRSEFDYKWRLAGKRVPSEIELKLEEKAA